MRMYRVVPGGKVLQVNYNDITDLCSKDGPQEAQPGGAWDLLAVCTVRILAEHGLLVDPADTIGSLLKVFRCVPEIRVERSDKSRNSS